MRAREWGYEALPQFPKREWTQALRAARAAAILIPFKLLAFWLIARGHGLLGLEVFVVAKIVGTAFLARVFALTKPALLTIGWFARFHAAFTAWRDRLYAYVKALPAWRAAKAWMSAARGSLRAWYRSRFGD